MFIKRTLMLFGVSVTSLTVIAQSVQVKKETARIRNTFAAGFEITLDATAGEVEIALTKLMKSFGKSKKIENYIVVNEPVIQGRKYVAAVYAVNKQLGNIVSAWIGINADDWNEKDAAAVNKDLEKVLHDFGINFYRERIQKQIDESLRAVQAVERQQQKLQNQNRDLNNKIENNKREKLLLEKSLENNKSELNTLIQRLEKNKKDHDSVGTAADQIKKMVELHKARQAKIN